jgi:hypothetical protein
MHRPAVTAPQVAFPARPAALTTCRCHGVPRRNRGLPGQTRSVVGVPRDGVLIDTEPRDEYYLAVLEQGIDPFTSIAGSLVCAGS